MAANKKINLFFLTHITDNKEDTIKFFNDINLMPKVVRCPNCKRILDTPYFMKISNYKSEDIRYKCGQKICKEKGSKNSISIKTGTWFGKCHFSLQKSFFDLLFCLQDVILDTIRETSIDVVNDATTDDDQKILRTSRETVFDYKRYCREIHVNIVLDESQQFIGGPGKIVEINESKFGKRKSHKGCEIGCLEVFVEKTDNFFLVTVPNREKETLLPLTKERISPGTTVMSDCWESMTVCLKKTCCTLLSITHYTLYIQTLAVIPKTLKIFGGKSQQIYLILTANMSNYTFIWPISMWRLMKDQTDDMF